jgi:hypothetical protein
VSPARNKLNFYIIFRRNSVFEEFDIGQFSNPSKFMDIRRIFAVLFSS